jgi:hypothetical protein
MNDRTFAALTRRTSLVALGGAGLATLAAPYAAVAKKNKRRNRKNNNDKKAKQQCQTQIDQCRDLIATRCTLDPNECTEGLECCESLGQCDFDGFFNCALLVST